MDKQQQILQAALRLFVQNGFHGTPTSLVAREAGVSNGTLFNYFKTKEDLVVALYNQVKDQASQYLIIGLDSSASLESLFRTLFTKSIDWGLDHPDAFLYIQQFDLSPHLTRLSAEALLEHSLVYRTFIERGINEGVLKALPMDLIYSLISSQLYGLFHHLVTHSHPQTNYHPIVEQVTNLLWEMIAT